MPLTFGDAPNSVILKMGHLDGAGRSSYANGREITFYRRRAAVPTGLVPRCFEVVEATDTSAWHLLLEDLTDSHRNRAGVAANTHALREYHRGTGASMPLGGIMRFSGYRHCPGVTQVPLTGTCKLSQSSLLTSQTALASSPLPIGTISTSDCSIGHRDCLRVIMRIAT
jgi:hypothetical protein